MALLVYLDKYSRTCTLKEKKTPLKMIQLHAQRATLGSEKNETFALQNE